MNKIDRANQEALNRINAAEPELVDIKYAKEFGYVIKKSKVYQNDKNNIATITVDKSGVKMDMEYVDKNARMYGVKKEWKKNIAI